MIKLIDLLREHQNGRQKPYMYSSVGFSCAVCEYYYKEGDMHMCSNQDYADYMNTNQLVDEAGQQIEDPTKWCSNWFEPKTQELQEKNKGLWHNIRAQRARGEKPARKGSKAYNLAVKAAKEINKNT
jgi:hypothetical protein